MTAAPGRGRILYVEDQERARAEIAAYLREEGFTVDEAGSGEAALDSASEHAADAALVDLELGKLGGLALIRRLRAGDARATAPDVPVVVLTGAGTIERAFEAGQLRVFAFLQKPVADPDELVRLLDEAVQHGRDARAGVASGTPHGATDGYGMVGASAAIETVRAAVARIAPTSARVLVTGESGSGKELVARALHQDSPRRAAPFIEVNCASIPRELVESELFGHERGSFTGAVSAKAGRLELANGGTLFLDEIGDMSTAAQATLLRTIETGQVQRVGATRSVAVDVRIIAATNKSLETEVEAGRFREDLYYRLNVLRIHVPALRERRSDIPALAAHFLSLSAAEHRRPGVTLSDDAIAALGALDWPGNVRELKNAIERLVIMSDGARITSESVQAVLAGQGIGPDGSGTAADPSALRATIRRREEQVILEELARSGWNVPESARRLGIGRASLYRKIREYGLEREPRDA